MQAFSCIAVIVDRESASGLDRQRSSSDAVRYAYVIAPRPVEVAEYCDERVCLSVCLFVCVSVCLSAGISPELHARSFYVCCLWPRLVPPSAALRYVMYFWFMDDVIFAHNGLYGSMSICCSE